MYLGFNVRRPKTQDAVQKTDLHVPDRFLVDTCIHIWKGNGFNYGSIIPKGIHRYDPDVTSVLICKVLTEG